MRRSTVLLAPLGWLLASLLAGHAGGQDTESSKDPYVVVLGIGQDAGIPQAGSFAHPGWTDGSLRRRVVCLGLVDPRSGGRWLFEATPDFRDQLTALHRLAPGEWEEWDAQGVRIEDRLAEVDVAFLDGTFFANGEIPGRDMSGFPHPFIEHSLRRFADLPAEEKAKIRFIHLNHTNPVQLPDSEARKKVLGAGFGLAEEGEIIPLRVTVTAGR